MISLIQWILVPVDEPDLAGALRVGGGLVLAGTKERAEWMIKKFLSPDRRELYTPRMVEIRLRGSEV